MPRSGDMSNSGLEPSPFLPSVYSDEYLAGCELFLINFYMQYKELTIEKINHAAVAMPIHCGDFAYQGNSIGTAEDRNKFKELSSVPVEF